MENKYSSTIVNIIETRQALLKLTDHDLCRAVGFDRQITLSLVKSGTMKFPLTKIPALGTALGLDPIDLMKTALAETSPDLLQVLKEVFAPLAMTATELNLIRHVRELSGDRQCAPIVFDGKGVIALVLT